LGATRAQSAITLTPKVGFGGPDGWLAPAEATHLQGASLQRGLTYNAANNHLYLVDRGVTPNLVRILDGTTGALLGSLDSTGITGGTFALNMVDVDEAGVIYAANLSGDTDVSPFKVYRWATEASSPTVAFNSTATPIANGTDIRVGDAFAVIGSGLSTQLLAGANAVGGTPDPGDNAFVILNTVDGSNYLGAVQDFVGMEPVNGSLRLGIDFVDSNTVIGRQASAGVTGTVDDFLAGTATLVALAELTNNNETALAVDRANQLLATVQFNTSDVRLYNFADPDNPVLMDTKNLIVGASVANANGTGDVKFGNGMLYVLNTNNGIQALEVVPEPVGACLSALGMAAGLMCRRRGA
jgi:Domain of unknown function (DUF4623)